MNPGRCLQPGPATRGGRGADRKMASAPARRTTISRGPGNHAGIPKPAPYRRFWDALARRRSTRLRLRIRSHAARWRMGGRPSPTGDDCQDRCWRRSVRHLARPPAWCSPRPIAGLGFRSCVAGPRGCRGLGWAGTVQVGHRGHGGLGMATRTTIVLEDDLDGGPADETVRFGRGGEAAARRMRSM